MREQLFEQFESALRALLGEAGDPGALPEFALEAPRNPDHGDFACNAALVLAKRLGEPPRAIAERLVAALLAGEAGVEAAEVVAGASPTRTAVGEGAA